MGTTTSTGKGLERPSAVARTVPPFLTPPCPMVKYKCRRHEETARARIMKEIPNGVENTGSASLIFLPSRPFNVHSLPFRGAPPTNLPPDQYPSISFQPDEKFRRSCSFDALSYSHSIEFLGKRRNRAKDVGGGVPEKSDENWWFLSTNNEICEENRRRFVKMYTSGRVLRVISTATSRLF